MLLSATPIHNPSVQNCNLFIFPNPIKLHNSSRTQSPTLQNSLLNQASLSSSSSSIAYASSQSLQNPNPKSLRHVSLSSPDEGEECEMVCSASAVASAIRGASNSPVDFTQKIEKNGKTAGLVLPSPEFQRLCLEQLDLFRRIVDPDAVISVYVRPAGNYVMDRLELRRVTRYPGLDASGVVILVGHFSIPTGLHATEAALASREEQVIPECRAVVFPMVKHPFVVGFLVAELEKIGTCNSSKVEGSDLMHCPSPEEACALPPFSDRKSWQIQTLKEGSLICKFTAEQKSNAINICRSLTMAYVMDQVDYKWLFHD